MIEPVVWIGFFVLVAMLMAFDLGILNRKAHAPSAKEALFTTLGWIFLALLFNIFIYFAYEYKWMNLGNYQYEPLNGHQAALKFFTGYLLEESLSIDNLFVMALIFAQFRVPKMYQHRILFWGIIGVILFRGLLIALGITLVHQFIWLFYIFGAFLIYTSWRMLRKDDLETDLHDHGVVKLIARLYPVTKHYHQGHFFAVEDGRKVVTPMFVALIVVETTDIMFAFDSVPAVFGITTDPFLVFTSNIFAILGLRSLYFVLANFLDEYRHLHYSLVAILFFIGVKMILIPLHIDIHELWSLLIIAAILAAGVVASLLHRRRHEERQDG